MWESLCGNVDIDYTGNQGVFTQIDQCQNELLFLSVKPSLLPG